MKLHSSPRLKTSAIVALAAAGSILLGGMISSAMTDSITVNDQPHVLLTSTSTSIP